MNAKENSRYDKAHGPKAVEPIHHAAMARDEMARILDLTIALESRLAQVADLARD